MSDIMCRMILHLPLVRISEIIQFMRARRGHRLDFLPVFKWHAPSQTSIENRDEIMKKITVAPTRHHLEKLVRKRLFLHVKQVLGQFADSLATLKCRPGHAHHPKAVSIEPQCIAPIYPQTVRQLDSTFFRWHEIRLIQIRSSMEPHADHHKSQRNRQNAGDRPTQDFQDNFQYP